MTAVLRDGPAGPAAVVLAASAGAGADHPFLACVAAGLAAAGLPVVRYDHPYRAAGRSRPDPLPVLQAALREIVRAHCGPRFVLAGKSLGGRVATMVADELGAAGCIVFGYPFHPPSQPARLRTAHLAALRTPTLVLQGERDAFGSRAEVGGYALSPTIAIQWFADGDHSLVPRRASGHDAAAHLRTAIAAAAAFAARCLGRA